MGPHRWLRSDVEKPRAGNSKTNNHSSFKYIKRELTEELWDQLMTLNQSSSSSQNPLLSSYGRKPWRDSHSESDFCRR